jgi:excisionase family DNA binding protein
MKRNETMPKPVNKLRDLEPLLTINEVAVYLGTSRRTIDTLMAKRKIRFIKMAHGVRIRVRDLAKLLDEYTVEKEAAR